MPQTVMDIRNLSKLYRLGEIGTGTLSHDLNRWWARMRGKEDPHALVGQINRRHRHAESDFVWALKEINFEISQGEVVGIIGANGAGKSTLLKLISRITAPTTGSIRTRGRLASLLEVGTGMHPEMTARENVYLNGAILGMKRREIARKFDDIIEFAGCQMYVETPVKRFSSGMRVRLGFAVAAFLDPEILILDEVLAVGDVEFQRQAIGKIQEIQSHSGRTILYVSHNLASVSELCARSLLLETGSLKMDGPTADVVEAYIQQRSDSDHLSWQRPANSLTHPMIVSAGILDRTENQLVFGDPLSLEAEIISPYSVQIALEVVIRDECQYPIAYLPSGTRFGSEFPLTAKTPTKIHCRISSLPLARGNYSLDLSVVIPGDRVVDQQVSILTFEIQNSDPCRTGHQFLQSSRQGCVHIPATFEASS